MTYTAGTDAVEMQDVRSENISNLVTGFALQDYVFKQLCMVETSSSWLETYFKETAADLTAGANAAVTGIPRLANFPYGEVTWTKATSYLKKFGMEGRISYEDQLTAAISVVVRETERIGRAVSKAVDAEIWNVITENRTPVNISSLTVSVGSEWNSTTLSNQNPIQNILDAKAKLYINNYNPDSNGYLCLSPTDYASLLGNANVRNAGQFYTDDVTRNGKVGFLLGLKVLVSNNVTADYAAIVIGQTAATWKQAASLTTATIIQEGIGITIRSWEIGCCQLKNPQAVCLIINTQA